MKKDIAQILILKKRLGRFAKIFVLIFLIVFIFANKESIFGMFDYGSVYGEFYNKFFKSIGSLIEESDFANIAPANEPTAGNYFRPLPLSSNKTPQELFETAAPEPGYTALRTLVRVPEVRLGENSHYEKNNLLEIKKLGVKAPIVFGTSGAHKALEAALKGGTVHFSESSKPGEAGSVVILGHSAPAGWPKRDYEWVFSRLNELENGDEIYIYYNHRKVIYRVSKKFFLKPGQDIPGSQDVLGANLYLITCWPPGRNQQRIVVQAAM